MVDVDTKLGRRQGFELLTLLLQPSPCKEDALSPSPAAPGFALPGALPPPPGVHSPVPHPVAWWPSDSAVRAVSAAAWAKAQADSAEWVDDVSTDVSGSDEDSGLVVDAQSDSSEGRRPDACRAAGARCGTPAVAVHW